MLNVTTSKWRLIFFIELLDSDCTDDRNRSQCNLREHEFYLFTIITKQYWSFYKPSPLSSAMFIFKMECCKKPYTNLITILILVNTFGGNWVRTYKMKCLMGNILELSNYLMKKGLGQDWPFHTSLCTFQALDKSNKNYSLSGRAT